MKFPMQMTEAEKMLKGATFYVCKALGGYEAAASYISIGKSQLARCASPRHPGDFINIATALALDLALGQPVLTNCLLAQFKRDAPEACTNIQSAFKRSTKEVSEFTAKFADALDNNDVDAVEAKDLLKEGQEAINELHHSMTLLAARAVA